MPTDALAPQRARSSASTVLMPSIMSLKRILWTSVILSHLYWTNDVIQNGPRDRPKYRGTFEYRLIVRSFQWIPDNSQPYIPKVTTRDIPQLACNVKLWRAFYGFKVWSVVFILVKLNCVYVFSVWYYMCHKQDPQFNKRARSNFSPTLAPIWLPHWPAWMCTISLMLVVCVRTVGF